MSTQNDRQPKDAENPPVGDDAPEAGDDRATAPKGAQTHQDTTSGSDPETFSREYVQRLRDEAAEARVRAKRADEAMERLRTMAIEAAVRDLLMNPDDLAWSEEFADEHGWPDHDKILAAAEAKVAARPYLGRPRGDVGMGVHSQESDDVSLVSILAAGA